MWLKKAGKGGHQELWRLFLHWREIPEGCGFGTAGRAAGGGGGHWAASARQPLFRCLQTLPVSLAALIAGGVQEMLGRSCTVALSAACSRRKTSKGQCWARSGNGDVELQPPEDMVPCPHPYPNTLIHVTFSDRGALGLLQRSTLPNFLSIINEAKSSEKGCLPPGGIGWVQSIGMQGHHEHFSTTAVLPLANSREM